MNPPANHSSCDQPIRGWRIQSLQGNSTSYNLPLQIIVAWIFHFKTRLSRFEGSFTSLQCSYFRLVWILLTIATFSRISKMMSEDDSSSSRSHHGIPLSYIDLTPRSVPTTPFRVLTIRNFDTIAKSVSWKQSQEGAIQPKENGRKKERHQGGMMFCQECNCHAHECKHPPTPRLIF